MRTRTNFLKVVRGEIDPPDHVDTALAERVSRRRGGKAALKRALRLVIESNSQKAGQGTHPVGKELAWSVLARVTETEKEHTSLMRYVVSMARMRPEYYGVTDPKTEWYCSSCREPRPIEDFEDPETIPNCRYHGRGKRKKQEETHETQRDLFVGPDDGDRGLQLSGLP